jgi:hypothetical protein
VAFFTFRNHIVSGNMCKCNFIYTYRKSAALPERIFKKLPNVEQHFVYISYTNCHPNQTINVECMWSSLCIPHEWHTFFTALISVKLSHSVTICGHRLYEILFERDEKCRKYMRNLFAPISKVCLWLYWFSQNPQCRTTFYKELLYEI